MDYLRIFGDFYPYKAEMADDSTGLLYFRSNGDAAKVEGGEGEGRENGRNYR